MSGAEAPDYLSFDDLLDVADGILSEVLLRDPGLLESAAARPRTTVFGEDAYRSLADKAAALLHAIARNDPLVDGNKRLAWAAARAFCLLNGHDIRYDIDDAETQVLKVAVGEIDAPDLGAWISEHLVEA